jgi:protein cornichon
LNPLIIPEYGIHFIMNVLFLIGAEWITLLINMPLIAYHINKFLTRPVMSGLGIYDPTSIMNAQHLSLAQREGWIKLGFYMITFFFYLYCMIAELIRD